MRKEAALISLGFILIARKVACFAPSKDEPLRRRETRALSRMNTRPPPKQPRKDTDKGGSRAVSRKSFCASMIGMTTAGTWMAAPKSGRALTSYSANARNMERLQSGDASGGSVYDNNPSNDRAKKRRALTGCKTPSAREEAAEILGARSLPEQECNIKVLEGETDFMLQALRNLDCPTCPYGISPKRN